MIQVECPPWQDVVLFLLWLEKEKPFRFDHLLLEKWMEKKDSKKIRIKPETFNQHSDIGSLFAALQHGLN